MDSEEIQTNIISFLSERGEEVSTLDISKAVFGKGSTKKMINKYLYSLEKMGEIEKVSEEDGTKPRWKVVN